MTDPSTNDNDNMPLPPGWSKGFSRSQKRNYYCHAASNHTQWHFPTASEALDPLKAKERLASAKSKPKKGISSNSNQKRQQPSSSSSNNGRDASSEQAKKRSRLRDSKHTASSNSGAINDDASCVAIIVPYRDVHAAQNRARHLQQFIPRMHTFLQAQVAKGTMSDYHIYIVEQSNDNRKFNRGKLLNIGFDIARKNKCRKANAKSNTKLINHDVFIFHDVDLLPSDALGPYYTQFPSVPIHIARVWDRYSNNPKYFGGIVSFSESDMKRINGYPNTFWGWGGEDDEMQLRCEKLGIKWEKPQVPRNYNSATSAPLITDLEQMDLNEKLSFLRQNKKWKCMVKWEALEEHETTWRRNGLADLNYSVLKMTDLDQERVKKDAGRSGGRSRATKITVDVKLNANHWANEKCSMDYVYSG